MSELAPNLSVLLGESVACIKVTGRANFNCSTEFKHLLQRLRQRGVERVILALSDCALMDSTFVGVLARAGLDLHRQGSAPTTPRIELLGATHRVDEMLDNLGVRNLFEILPASAPMPAGLAPVDFPAEAPSRREQAETCLAAHRTLMEFNETNRRKFQDVEKFLAEDLKKEESDRTT